MASRDVRPDNVARRRKCCSQCRHSREIGSRMTQPSCIDWGRLSRTSILLALVLLWGAVCHAESSQSTHVRMASAGGSLHGRRRARAGFVNPALFPVQSGPCCSRSLMEAGCSSSRSRKWAAVQVKSRKATVLSVNSSAERRRVKAVFTDVDGTLLNSKHRLSDHTITTLQKAMDQGIPVVMATGKARGSWVGMLREQMGMSKDGWTLNGPGVFIQGLLVCDEQGKVVQRTLLDNSVVRQINEFCASRSLQVVAYTSDDEIVSAQTDEYSDLLVPFSEPTPRSIGREGMDLLSTAGQPDAFKLILLGPEPTLAALRDDLEHLVKGVAHITKAMDRMLEVLPPGTSKASGVSRAMQLLGVTPGDCMALGDGENDLEMLKMVREDGGVAVAVGNAVPKLKAAAEFTVGTNDENGFAEAIDRFILGASVPGT